MKKLLISGIVIVLLAGGLALRFYALPVYRHQKEIRFAEQARAYMDKNDYRNASLSARQALNLNSSNLIGCRVMAELADIGRSTQTIDWRKRVAAIEPSTENKLMLASAAMRYQGRPFLLAAQTLDELRAAGQNSAAYHAACAELALRSSEAQKAAEEFETALRLEPTNDFHRLNLAVLRLSSTNDLEANAARAALEQVSTNASTSAAALRWLVTDRLGHRDLASAERFSARLLASSETGIQDRLQHLTILNDEKSAGFDSFLGSVKAGASTNAVEIYALCAWLNGHGLANDAFKWLTNCPASIRSEQPAPLAMVDCFVAKKDWSDLESYLLSEKWGDRDFERLAFLSLVAQELKQPLGVEARWRAAVREAGDRVGPLIKLHELATHWGREKEREEVLWVIAQRCPRERWSFGELERLYLAEKNTRGLNKLYAMKCSLDTKDMDSAHNLAATSLLLKINLDAAHRTAKEVYSQRPEDPICVSTYAYSLLLQGRSKEGISALERLKGNTLETAPAALYYGLLLCATGQTNKAERYLTIAKNSDLLPEEKNLAIEAQSAL